ncbi:MAG TPA: hypothetical protein VHE35_27565 [Kofleriaceae bacterium]|nr:hypothetical protein [Kofleriaceae bacterium]
MRVRPGSSSCLAIAAVLALHGDARATPAVQDVAARRDEVGPIGAVARHGAQTLFVALEPYPEEHAVLHVTDRELRDLQVVDLPGDNVLSSAIAVSGDRAVVGLPNASEDGGAVVLLEADRARRWHVRQTFGGRAWFGISVAIRGELVAIGDRDLPGTDDGWGPGAVHLYRLRGRRWRLAQELYPADPDVRGFGYHVAIDGDRLTVQSIWDRRYDDADRYACYHLRRGVAVHGRSCTGAQSSSIFTSPSARSASSCPTRATQIRVASRRSGSATPSSTMRDSFGARAVIRPARDASSTPSALATRWRNAGSVSCATTSRCSDRVACSGSPSVPVPSTAMRGSQTTVPIAVGGGGSRRPSPQPAATTTRSPLTRPRMRRASHGSRR